MSDLARITKAILADYVLPVHGIHGVVHWARVLENGLSVARKTGADCEVVTLFALFHDSRRVSDGHDHGHGLRGGELARSLRGDLIHLDDRAFELLFEACRLHTDGLNDGDPTLLACWDADRLDLGLSLIHISEPTRLLSISYAVFCLKKKKKTQKTQGESTQTY